MSSIEEYYLKVDAEKERIKLLDARAELLEYNRQVDVINEIRKEICKAAKLNPPKDYIWVEIDGKKMVAYKPIFETRYGGVRITSSGDMINGSNGCYRVLSYHHAEDHPLPNSLKSSQMSRVIEALCSYKILDYFKVKEKSSWVPFIEYRQDKLNDNTVPIKKSFKLYDRLLGDDASLFMLLLATSFEVGLFMLAVFLLLKLIY